MRINDVVVFEIKPKNKEFWVYRVDSVNDKELIWITKTRKEAQKRINKRTMMIRSKPSQKVKVNKRIFNKLNKIYNREIKK